MELGAVGVSHLMVPNRVKGRVKINEVLVSGQSAADSAGECRLHHPYHYVAYRQIGILG